MQKRSGRTRGRGRGANARRGHIPSVAISSAMSSERRSGRLNAAPLSVRFGGVHSADRERTRTRSPPPNRRDDNAVAPAVQASPSAAVKPRAIPAEAEPKAQATAPGDARPNAIDVGALLASDDAHRRAEFDRLLSAQEMGQLFAHLAQQLNGDTDAAKQSLKRVSGWLRITSKPLPTQLTQYLTSLVGYFRSYDPELAVALEQSISRPRPEAVDSKEQAAASGTELKLDAQRLIAAALRKRTCDTQKSTVSASHPPKAAPSDDTAAKEQRSDERRESASKKERKSNRKAKKRKKKAKPKKAKRRRHVASSDSSSESSDSSDSDGERAQPTPLAQAAPPAVQKKPELRPPLTPNPLPHFQSGLSMNLPPPLMPPLQWSYPFGAAHPPVQPQPQMSTPNAQQFEQLQWAVNAMVQAQAAQQIQFVATIRRRILAMLSAERMVAVDDLRLRYFAQYHSQLPPDSEFLRLLQSIFTGAFRVTEVQGKPLLVATPLPVVAPLLPPKPPLTPPPPPPTQLVTLPKSSQTCRPSQDEKQRSRSRDRSNRSRSRSRSRKGSHRSRSRSGSRSRRRDRSTSSRSSRSRSRSRSGSRSRSPRRRGRGQANGGGNGSANGDKPPSDYVCHECHMKNAHWRWQCPRYQCKKCYIRGHSEEDCPKVQISKSQAKRHLWVNQRGIGSGHQPSVSQALKPNGKPRNGALPFGGPGSRGCYNCGSELHFARECPNPRTSNGRHDDAAFERWARKRAALMAATAAAATSSDASGAASTTAAASQSAWGDTRALCEPDSLEPLPEPRTTVLELKGVATTEVGEEAVRVYCEKFGPVRALKTVNGVWRVDFDKEGGADALTRGALHKIGGHAITPVRIARS